MDSNNMKNMIVLRNLPSNIVEEAFVVFKSNVKIHKYEKVNKMNDKEQKNKNKDYMIKEAELILNDYISKMEKTEYEKSIGNKKLKEKYKKLKALTIFFGIFSSISFILMLLR